MRILQIIDSLEAGGAERIAVNYANALANEIEFSGLVATRKEGFLTYQIEKKVEYFFLNRKSTFDLKALFRLKAFVKKNKVKIIHAHGTSFFIGLLLKIIYPKIKLIWHEHYGNRANQTKKGNIILILSSFFFSGIFVVNNQLAKWAKKRLFTKKVYFIPNFTKFNSDSLETTILKGDFGKRILFLANLKKPKNHITLLSAFQKLKLSESDWTLHLVGKDYNDEYSNVLKEFILENKLSNSVFVYNSQNDIQNILNQATIGILASTDEGFPVTLIEYGLGKLAVVSTNVGYCSEIIIHKKTGLLFNPLNENELQEQLVRVTSDLVLRNNLATNLNKLVLANFLEEKSIQLLLSKYKEI